MTELEIYDSQGERYDTTSGVETSARIESFFFGGVRVYLDVGSTSELIVFFRARETKSGRAEQYYAVYRTENLRKLFDRFMADLRQRIEGEFDMTLQTTSDDVELFTKLDSSQKPVPGSSDDHRTISTLLTRGDNVRCGVSTADEALGLFLKYVQGDAGTLAIGENTGIEELEGCDLTIEVGDYDDLEPLGETAELFEEENRTRSSAAAGGSGRPRATAGGSTSSGGGRSRAVKLGAIACLGLVGLVVVALVGINVAAVMGFTSPAASPVTFVGDESAEPTATEPLENVTIEGEETHDLMEDGEFVESVDVVPFIDDDGNESVMISGLSNQETVTIETDDKSVNLTAADEFENNLTVSSTGDSNITIAAGEDPEGDEWPEQEESFILTIVDPDAEPDDTDDESGDEGAEDTDGAEDGDGTNE